MLKTANPWSRLEDGLILPGFIKFGQVWPGPWLSYIKNWLTDFSSFEAAHEDLQIGNSRTQNRFETKKYLLQKKAHLEAIFAHRFFLVRTKVVQKANIFLN